jgi:hypothetical protein
VVKSSAESPECFKVSEELNTVVTNFYPLNNYHFRKLSHLLIPYSVHGYRYKSIAMSFGVFLISLGNDAAITAGSEHN